MGPVLNRPRVFRGIDVFTKSIVKVASKEIKEIKSLGGVTQRIAGKRYGPRIELPDRSSILRSGSPHCYRGPFSENLHFNSIFRYRNTRLFS